MAVPGFPEALIQLLSTSMPPGEGSPADWPAAELLTEASWVAAYMTAGAEAHLNRLVALGLVPPLAAHLQHAAHQAHPHLAHPLSPGKEPYLSCKFWGC